MTVSHQWMIDVIDDLQNFSQEHGYGRLAEALADAKIVGHIELNAAQSAVFRRDHSQCIVQHHDRQAIGSEEPS